MPPYFNGVDHRAFTPSPRMQASEDVLEGIGFRYLDEASSPFGVGIYKQFPDGSVEAEAMPLYFVSKAVCDNRSKTAPPMEPGWYLSVDEADNGREFQVHVSARGCSRWVTIREAVGADIAIAGVSIDGVRSDNYGSSIEHMNGYDVRFRGFVEFAARSIGSGYANMRAFTFSKAKLVDSCDDNPEEGTSESVGEISVTFAKADKGPVMSTSASYTSGASQSKSTSVSEKDAIKQGKSVSVKADGRSFQASANRVSYSIRNRSALQSMGISIRMRERVWLQSRRIIDADGKPMTKEMANLAVESSIGETTPPKKKVKHEKLEDDIIDLT